MINVEILNKYLQNKKKSCLLKKDKKKNHNQRQNIIIDYTPHVTK